jgi:hypothetical protein
MATAADILRAHGTIGTTILVNAFTASGARLLSFPSSPVIHTRRTAVTRPTGPGCRAKLSEGWISWWK